MAGQAASAAVQRRDLDAVTETPALGRGLMKGQHGVRRGAAIDLMKPVVSQLTQDDMIAISAYAAAQEP